MEPKLKVEEIRYRLMTLADITRVPIRCQGDASALAARIREVGSSAVLAFDGEQHVAQLQFRPYCRALRSPNGLWDPRYWGDFNLRVTPCALCLMHCHRTARCPIAVPGLLALLGGFADLPSNMLALFSHRPTGRHRRSGRALSRPGHWSQDVGLPVALGTHAWICGHHRESQPFTPRRDVVHGWTSS